MLTLESKYQFAGVLSRKDFTTFFIETFVSIYFFKVEQSRTMSGKSNKVKNGHRSTQKVKNEHRLTQKVKNGHRLTISV